MRIFRKLAVGVTFAAGIAAGSPLASQSATAATYNFDLSGQYNYSWSMDSNPTPTTSAPDSFYISGVGPGDALWFYTSASGGGLIIQDVPGQSSDINLLGPQLFSGDTSAPQFILGTYSLMDPEGNTDTLAISETPLPATLPLFASGLGALGLLGWRRKRKAHAAA